MCARALIVIQWGSAAEILALSHVLRKPLKVWKRDNSAFAVVEQYGEEYKNAKDQKVEAVNVLYVDGNHYQVD